MGRLKHLLLRLKVVRDCLRARDFFKRFDIRISRLLLPVALSLLASSFEAVSVALLIPFTHGVLKMNFMHVRDIPVLKTMMEYLPGSIGQRNFAMFVILLSAIIGSAIMKNIWLYLSQIAVSYQVRKISHRLREAIFARYFALGKLFFDRENIGRLAQVLMGYTAQIAGSLNNMNRLLSDFFMWIVYITMLFVISWQLTLAVIFTFPVYHFALKWLFGRVEKNSLQLMETSNSLSKKICEILGGMVLIKSYSREDDENTKCGHLSEQYRKTEFSMDRKMGLISPVNEVTTLLVLLLLISVMSFLLIRMQIGSVGRFLVFFYLIRRVLNLTGTFNHAKSLISNLKGPIKEIMWVFDDGEKFFVKDGEKEFGGLKTTIEIRGLHFAYRKDVPVLTDLNILIPQGKLTAIVGSSGAGKTTLINLIMRFYDCDPGVIFLDGEDIRGFCLKSLRRHMAIVSQDTFLFSETLRENIVFGLSSFVSEEELWEATRKAQLESFVQSLPEGFETLVGDRGVKLSGGEKQRVAIARAILKKAEILILDEATSSLDSKTESLVQTAIGEAIQNRTSIVIAHRLSTIRHADQIIVLENGEMVETGTLRDLLARKGKFFEYWEAQKFF